MTVLRHRHPSPLKTSLTTEEMKKALSKTPRTSRYRRPIDQEFLQQLKSQIPPLQDQPAPAPEKESSVIGLKKKPFPLNKAVKSVKAQAPAAESGEYDHFIETGEVTGYTPKPPRPGPKRKKRLVKSPGELQLTRRLPLLVTEVDAADKSDAISTSEPSPPEEVDGLGKTNLHTLTQFGRLLKKCRPPTVKKVPSPNDACLSWIDEDLLQAKTPKREVSMDGRDGKYLALTKKSAPTPVTEDVYPSSNSIVNASVEEQAKPRNLNLTEKFRKIKVATEIAWRPGKLELDGFETQPPHQKSSRPRKSKAPKFPTKKEFFNSHPSISETGTKTTGLNKTCQHPSEMIDTENGVEEDEMLLSISRTTTTLPLTNQAQPRISDKTNGDFITARELGMISMDMPATLPAIVLTRRQKTARNETSITNPKSASSPLTAKPVHNATSTLPTKEPTTLVPAPQTPSRPKLHPSRQPGKSIAEILKQKSSPLKKQPSMAGLYRSPTKKLALVGSTSASSLRNGTTSIEVPTTPFIQESSLVPPSSPPEMVSTIMKLPIKNSAVLEFWKPLKPSGAIQSRSTTSINSILRRTQTGSPTLPRRIGLPPSSTVFKRHQTGFVPPLLNTLSSDGPQLPTSGMKPVEVKRKRNMTVMRYKPTMGGLAEDESEEDVSRKATRAGTQGRKRKGEVEEESARIAAKKRKTTSMHKVEKLTLLGVTPSRKYIDKVTNFNDVKDAWS